MVMEHRRYRKKGRGKKKKKNHSGERDQVIKGEILSKVSAIGSGMFGLKKNLKPPRGVESYHLIKASSLKFLMVVGKLNENL